MTLKIQIRLAQNPIPCSHRIPRPFLDFCRHLQVYMPLSPLGSCVRALCLCLYNPAPMTSPALFLDFHNPCLVSTFKENRTKTKPSTNFSYCFLHKSLSISFYCKASCGPLCSQVSYSLPHNFSRYFPRNRFLPKMNSALNTQRTVFSLRYIC